MEAVPEEQIRPTRGVNNDMHNKAFIPSWLVEAWAKNPLLKGLKAALRYGNPDGMRFMSQYHPFSTRFSPKPEACKYKSTKATKGTSAEGSPGGLVAIHSPTNLRDVNSALNVTDLNQSRFMQTVVNTLGDKIGKAMDAVCHAKRQPSPCTISPTDVESMKGILADSSTGTNSYAGLIDKLLQDGKLNPNTFDDAMADFASFKTPDTKITELLTADGISPNILEATFISSLKTMRKEGMQIQVSQKFLDDLPTGHPLKAAYESPGGTELFNILPPGKPSGTKTYDFTDEKGRPAFQFDDYRDTQAFVVREPLPGQTTVHFWVRM